MCQATAAAAATAVMPAAADPLVLCPLLPARCDLAPASSDRLCLGCLSQVDTTKLLTRTVEFPSMGPAHTGKPYKHAYMLADRVGHPVLWGPAQALLKVTLPLGGGASSATAPAAPAAAAPQAQEELWAPGDRCFPGEPMFVAKEGGKAEDEGWVIVAVHDAAKQKADICILDAQDISAGPVAVIHLPHHLPASLHGSFSPAYMGPDPKDPTQPQWKEPNRIRAW